MRKHEIIVCHRFWWSWVTFMVTLLSETFPFPVHCQVYHVLIKISKHVCFAVSAVLNFCCNWRTFQGHRQWRVHYFQADSQLNFPNWTRNRKIWAKNTKNLCENWFKECLTNTVMILRKFHTRRLWTCQPHQPHLYSLQYLEKFKKSHFQQ